MSETSPAYEAGKEISVAGNGGAAPDDHFERQAQASFSQWAALRRALERANELIDQLRAENAESTARVSELVRANAQLSANLEESLAREGDAKEQAGWLKGVMTTAAGALMEGLRPTSINVGSAESRADIIRALGRRDPPQ